MRAAQPLVYRCAVVEAKGRRIVVGAEEVLARVAALRPVRSFGFVGIGGHGASGKTTLARALPAEATIGTDEFWDGATPSWRARLPGSTRTTGRRRHREPPASSSRGG